MQREKRTREKVQAGKIVTGKECKGGKCERGKECREKSEEKSVTGKSVRGKSMTGKCGKRNSMRGEKCKCFHEPHLIEVRQDHWFTQDPLTSERINISRIWILPASVLRPGFWKGKFNLLFLLG